MDYPAKLKAAPTAWIFEPRYRAVHEQNQHLSIVICGKPGCGKSYISLNIAEMFDPNFDPKKSVVFNAQDFADLVASEPKKGSVIVVDDSGITAGSGDAMTKAVKNISKTLQSIRHKNLIIILNLPNLFLLAKSVRTLIEFYIEPVKINREKKINHAKFRIISTNPVTGNMYLKMPIRPVTEKTWYGYDRVHQVKTLTVPFNKPSTDITKVYEQLKNEKLGEFNIKQADSLRSDFRKKKGVAIDMDLEVDKVISNVGDYLLKGKVSHSLIKNKLKIGSESAWNIKQLVDKKLEDQKLGIEVKKTLNTLSSVM